MPFNSRLKINSFILYVRSRVPDSIPFKCNNFTLYLASSSYFSNNAFHITPNHCCFDAAGRSIEPRGAGTGERGKRTEEIIKLAQTFRYYLRDSFPLQNIKGGKTHSSFSHRKSNPTGTFYVITSLYNVHFFIPTRKGKPSSSLYLER